MSHCAGCEHRVGGIGGRLAVCPTVLAVSDVDSVHSGREWEVWMGWGSTQTSAWSESHLFP